MSRAVTYAGYSTSAPCFPNGRVQARKAHRAPVLASAAAAVSAASVRQAVPSRPLSSISEAPARGQLAEPVALAALAAVTVLAAWQRLWLRPQPAAEQQYPGLVGLIRPAVKSTESDWAAADPEFRLALARTRQAIAVHRALGFVSAGTRARAYTEVRRALHEHSICRQPLLNTWHTKAELAQLYCLYLEQGPTPDLSALLLLRGLLDLEFEQAEQIERQVAEQQLTIRKSYERQRWQETLLPPLPAGVASSAVPARLLKPAPANQSNDANELLLRY